VPLQRYGHSEVNARVATVVEVIAVVEIDVHSSEAYQFSCHEPGQGSNSRNEKPL
jgi:hypothetical protein